MRSWSLVVVLLLLMSVGACSDSATTTTDRATAEAAAVALVREEVPWVGFSDGELVSAMLFSCSTGSQGPFGKVVEWMLEWGMTRFDVVAMPAGEDKTTAEMQQLRKVGFGGEDFIGQVRDFEFATFWASQNLCPETWELQREALDKATG